MIPFILNTPYTFIGLVVGIISFPNTFSFRKDQQVFILKIKSFWWTFGYLKNARAMTIGHVVLLSSYIEDNDLEHELVHIAQYQKEPFIHPILYLIELFRKGYRNNKYEIEAYQKAGNIYKD